MKLELTLYPFINGRHHIGMVDVHEKLLTPKSVYVKRDYDRATKKNLFFVMVGPHELRERATGKVKRFEDSGDAVDEALKYIHERKGIYWMSAATMPKLETP